MLRENCSTVHPAMCKEKEINNQFNVLKKLFKVHLLMLYGMDANGKQGEMNVLGKKKSVGSLQALYCVF